MKQIAILTLIFLNWTLAASAHAQQQVERETQLTFLKDDAGNIMVKSGSNHFATLNFKAYDKPIVYPIYAPGQIAMTRNYPMLKNVDGEASDHPHHKSLWFAHGDVDGVDFWSEKGRIVTESVSIEDSKIKVENKWMNGEQTLAIEKAVYEFHEKGDLRWIDFSTEVSPADQNGRLTFGDTKEGTFAIRTHPRLRLENNEKEGVNLAAGQAVNSEGDQGRAVWGKKAKWVHYWANMTPEQSEETIYSVVLMDHPGNLRHPTTWHARSYGLVAANPFGLHHFLGREKGTGNFTSTAAEPLQLRYRVLFSRGKLQHEQIDSIFNEFTESTE